MTDAKISAIDPDNIQEIVCDGGFNLHWGGGRATITFTHNRLRAQPLFEDSQIKFDAVVRARIATSLDNILAMRDLLNRLFPEGQSIDAQAEGSTSGSVH